MTSPYYNSQSAEEEKFLERFREEGLETKMNYKVKIKQGAEQFSWIRIKQRIGQRRIRVWSKRSKLLIGKRKMNKKDDIGLFDRSSTCGLIIGFDEISDIGECLH